MLPTLSPIPRRRQSVFQPEFAIDSSISSLPGHPMIERPTGIPSTSATGIDSCGAPNIPAIQVSEMTGMRKSHIRERGWPATGAGKGVVGKQMTVF